MNLQWHDVQEVVTDGKHDFLLIILLAYEEKD